MSKFGAYGLLAYQCKQSLKNWELLEIQSIITCVAQLLPNVANVATKV